MALFYLRSQGTWQSGTGVQPICDGGRLYRFDATKGNFGVRWLATAFDRPTTVGCESG